MMWMPAWAGAAAAGSARTPDDERRVFTHTGPARSTAPRTHHEHTLLKDGYETHLPTEQQAAEADARLSGADEHTRRARGAEAPAGQGSQAAHGVDPAQAAALSATAAGRCEHFPPRYRLRKRGEFVALQRDGRRATTRNFVIITRPTNGPSRLGITTSRKVGGAPARNRIRRLVREFFRRHRPRVLPPRDVLVIARPGAARVSYCDVSDELSRTLHPGAAS